MSARFWLLVLCGQVVHATFLLPVGFDTIFRYSSWAVGVNSTSEIFGCFVKTQVMNKPWVKVALECYTYPLDNKTEKHRDYLNLPFTFHYQDGMVQKLHFSADDSVKSMNLKKAIANLFQVNMERVPFEDDTGPEGETTVEGDCDVVYATVQHERTLHVTKAINFDSCNNRQDISYGLRYTVGCPDCHDDRNVNVKTTYSHTIDNGTLYYGEVVSKHLLAINRNVLLETRLIGKLEFYSVKDIHRRISAPEETEKIHTLVFSNKELEQQELFMKYRRDEVSRPVDKKFLDFYLNKAHKARSIRWHPLKDLILHTPYTDLIETGDKLYRDEDDRVYALERGLASAGTVNTVGMLIHFFREGKISVERMSMLLKIVQETDFPSLSLIKLLVEHTDDEFQKDPFLHQSVWLTIGEVMRATFGNTLDKPARKEHHPAGRKELVETILDNYKTNSIEQKILFLKVMGNSALKEFLPELKKAIATKEEPFVIRLEAIYALRLLKDEYTLKVQDLLLPVFLDEDDLPEIRMAAVAYFFHCMPERHLLDIVASQLQKERSREVAGFTYSILLSLSNTTVPCLPSFSRDVALSISQLYKHPKIGKSVYEHSYSALSDLLTAVSLDTITIQREGSADPRHQIHSWEIVAGGNWFQYFLQLGYTKVSADDDDIDGDNVMVFMRYKQLDFGFMFLNRTAFEKLYFERDLTQIGGIYDEVKKFFTDSPDIKSLMHLPTVIGVPITHSVKVTDLMASWLSLRKTKILEPTVFSHVGYKEDSGQFQLRQFKVLPISIDNFIKDQ